jgi:hypothetical protein
LWAQPVGGDLFKLRNIPWETDALHFLDVVRARHSDDGQWDVLDVSPGTDVTAALDVLARGERDGVISMSAHT